MTERRALPYFLVQNAFATARADELGLSRGRMRASDLQIPFRGVRSEGLDLDNLVHRCRAAATFMGEFEAFSHSTALGLWGAPLPTGLDSAADALHIVTRGTTRRRRAGVVGHRVATQTQLQASQDGLITVAPAAAWCQFASQRGDRSREKMLLALVATGDYLITGRRIPGGREPAACTLTQLEHAVGAYGRARGARLLAEALPLVRAGVDSAKETELRLLLIGEGLTAPEVGHVIHTRLGPLAPDLAYPHRRVLLEYEGDVHRTNKRRWRGDFDRVRAFQETGWTVIRVNADDLSDAKRRAALVAQLRGLLARGDV